MRMAFAPIILSNGFLILLQPGEFFRLFSDACRIFFQIGILQGVLLGVIVCL